MEWSTNDFKTTKTRINTALRTLKNEFAELRRQDLQLFRHLMEIHYSIRSFHSLRGRLRFMSCDDTPTLDNHEFNGSHPLGSRFLTRVQSESSKDDDIIDEDLDDPISASYNTSGSTHGVWLGEYVGCDTSFDVSPSNRPVTENLSTNKSLLRRRSCHVLEGTPYKIAPLSPVSIVMETEISWDKLPVDLSVNMLQEEKIQHLDRNAVVLRGKLRDKTPFSMRSGDGREQHKIPKLTLVLPNKIASVTPENNLPIRYRYRVEDEVIKQGASSSSIANDVRFDIGQDKIVLPHTVTGRELSMTRQLPNTRKNVTSNVLPTSRDVATVRIPCVSQESITGNGLVKSREACSPDVQLLSRKDVTKNLKPMSPNNVTTNLPPVQYESVTVTIPTASRNGDTSNGSKQSVTSEMLPVSLSPTVASSVQQESYQGASTSNDKTRIQESYVSEIHSPPQSTQRSLSRSLSSVPLVTLRHETPTESVRTLSAGDSPVLDNISYNKLFKQYLQVWKKIQTGQSTLGPVDKKAASLQIFL